MLFLRALAGVGRIRLSAALLAVGIPFMVSGNPPLRSSSAQPPLHTPSQIAWTEQTVSAASSGDAVRGLVIARRCARCHGAEGFSSDPLVPNLAGMETLTMWKQMNDFRDGKRKSAIMSIIAADLAVKDYADLAAYYAMLPTYPDPFDTRSFPQLAPASTHMAVAARLVEGGDGPRGIPPCQACHGPISHKIGAPSLAAQNSNYIQEELEEFASGHRANDINMPMRTIASLLTDDEKQALGAYYGSGLGSLPVGASVPAK